YLLLNRLNMDGTSFLDHAAIKEEFEEDEIPASADSFIQDRNNNVPIKMEFDSTLILKQWNLDFPETKLMNGQNEELEENKMPVNADFYVQVTNMKIPIENEFGSTAILTQLKPDLDFPETNLQEGRNEVYKNESTESAIHSCEKPHRCEIGEKKIVRLDHFQLHQKIHSEEKSHQCEICEKRLSRFDCFISHRKVYFEEKHHECEICEKKFSRLDNLKTHQLIHSGEKPHECEICKKIFSRLDSLKTHQLIHSGKKPHECEICKKIFSRLDKLKTHQLIHSG
ncbi:hypothetical protein QYM36_014280, partial [Artemia franciscana]